MRIIPCEQGTAEWLDVRCGKITASRICDVMAVLVKASKNGKAGDAAGTAIGYSIELIAERMSGRTAEHYVSPEMKWGRVMEEAARTEYEMEYGVLAQTVGFILHPTEDFTGASPDSLIGDDGGIEIKCPKTETHIRWRMEGIVPKEHRDQMHWNMACAERSWWDFVSYDPRIPGLELFVVRMQRDDQRIAEIEQRVAKFNSTVEEMIAELSKFMKKLPAKAVFIDTRTDLEQLYAMIDAQELTP